MNETLTVFMISEIERLREEGREPARRIYHNMLRTLRESAGKEEIGFEEVTPVFLGKYEHWLLAEMERIEALIASCMACAGSPVTARFCSKRCSKKMA